MCKTKMAADASQPLPARISRPRSTKSPGTPPSTGSAQPRSASTSNVASASYATSSSSSAAAYNAKASSSSTASHSSRTSLASLRESISESPHIYDISELRAATNNFLAKHYSSSAASSSAACWRCTLRGKDTLVFQRKFYRTIQTSQLRQRLAVICRSHHVSIVKLLGAAISGEHIYLVYEFIQGANLANCLRNPRNPEFTVLSSWISRMQIAADLADGLDYIHNSTGLNVSLVHNHIKSSAVIITEPSYHAKICHFGAAQLCGEAVENEDTKKSASEEIDDEISEEFSRPNGGERQFRGVRGYMAPEFQATGFATQKSDVYSFGVVILELLSGEEPFKYRFDKRSGDFVRTSVIETAKAAAEGGGEGLRRWVDRRMRDSFPVDVAEKVTRLALDCVHVEPDKRPGMGRVAGKISKLYLESKHWSDNVKIPKDISVSLAPR